MIIKRDQLLAGFIVVLSFARDIPVLPAPGWTSPTGVPQALAGERAQGLCGLGAGLGRRRWDLPGFGRAAKEGLFGVRGLPSEALLGALGEGSSVPCLLWSLQTDEGVLMEGHPSLVLCLLHLSLSQSHCSSQLFCLSFPLLLSLSVCFPSLPVSSVLGSLPTPPLFLCPLVCLPLSLSPWFSTSLVSLSGSFSFPRES